MQAPTGQSRSVVREAFPANSSYLQPRVRVIVAVKNDLALIAAAAGPYREFSPDFGSGKASAANLEIALDMLGFFAC